MLLKPPSALHLCLLFQDAWGEEGIITQLKMSFAFSVFSMQLLSFSQTNSCQEIC